MYAVAAARQHHGGQARTLAHQADQYQRQNADTGADQDDEHGLGEFQIRHQQHAGEDGGDHHVGAQPQGDGATETEAAMRLVGWGQAVLAEVLAEILEHGTTPRCLIIGIGGRQSVVQLNLVVMVTRARG